MRVLLVSFLAIILMPLRNAASAPVLVKDINTSVCATTSQGAALGNVLIFSKFTPQTGQELWMSNGQPGAASLLKDIHPGPGSSSPYDFRMLGGRLFFFADNGQTGRELWVTDGTSVGTYLLCDIYPGPLSSSPFELEAGREKLFFTAVDATHDRRLWVSDGTASGTHVVDPALPAGDISILQPSDEIWRVSQSSDRIIFRTGKSVNYNDRFYVTDGTVSGTFRLPVASGRKWGDDFGELNGNFYGCVNFENDGNLDFLVCITTSTIGLVPFDSRPFRMSAGSFINFKDELYFFGSEEGHFLLFRIDPIAGMAYQVTQIGGGVLSGMNVMNHHLYFGLGEWTGLELWKCGGTATGPVMVKKLNNRYWDTIFATQAVGTHLFFTAANDADQVHLWVSDGTATGTLMLPPDADFLFTQFSTLDAWLLATSQHPARGLEIWRSNGTAAGTQVIESGIWGTESAGIGNMTATGKALFFGAFDDMKGWELWRTDGSSAGTSLVKDINPGPAGSALRVIATRGEKMYLTATTANEGSELWISDGTGAGTRLVKDIYPGRSESGITAGTLNDQGLLFFRAWDANDYGLWKSDGTAAGTVMITTLSLVGLNLYPSGQLPSVAVGSRALFCNYDSSHGLELWSSDGTTAGTSLLKDLIPGAAHSKFAIHRVDAGHALLNVSDEWRHNASLWRSDGTPEGTVRIHDEASSPFTLRFSRCLGIYGGVAYLAASADDYVTSQQLWRMDVNTGVAQALTPLHGCENVERLTKAGASLYFTAYDEDNMVRPWRSDGTVAGTKRMNFGPGGENFSQVTHLTPYGNALVLFAQGRHTFEWSAWITDGTPGGTRLLSSLGWQDHFLREGAQLIWKDGLYMNFDDDFYGEELWKIPLDAALKSTVRHWAGYQ